MSSSSGVRVTPTTDGADGCAPSHNSAHGLPSSAHPRRARPSCRWRAARPCASLCEGEFGINGYFIGVPSLIGSNGVERILEFELNDKETSELNNTLEAVKKTVEETGL